MLSQLPSPSVLVVAEPWHRGSGALGEDMDAEAYKSRNCSGFTFTDSGDFPVIRRAQGEERGVVLCPVLAAGFGASAC